MRSNMLCLIVTRFIIIICPDDICFVAVEYTLSVVFKYSFTFPLLTCRVFLPFDPRTKRPEPGTVPDLYPNPYSNPYPGSRPGPGQGHFIPSPRGLPASRPQTFQVVSKNTPIGVPFFGIFTATCLGGIEFKSGQGRFGSKK